MGSAEADMLEQMKTLRFWIQVGGGGVADVSYARDSGERELILRCQAGDRHAFERIYHRYRDDVFRFSYLVVRDQALAQDVVQEAFIKVYRSIAKFQFRSSFKSWLYRIAVNEAISVMRRRKIVEDLAPEPVTGPLDRAPIDGYSHPEQAALDAEERELLRSAIDQLDPLHRTVVILKYFHEFSDAEIAEAVGCPAGTVKSRLHRARELLRQSVSRQGIVSKVVNLFS